ncbi:MAG: DNA methyltransferase [Promethearchaeota archaeon]
MTDLIILLSSRGTVPDTTQVVHVIQEQRATVASFITPKINDAGEIERRAFIDFHVQHRIDFSQIRPRFRLKDIILLKATPITAEPNFILIALWNYPDSTFNIDAVRIPHSGWFDPRNNPKGKNPGNIWSFSGALQGEKGSGPEIKTIQETPSILPGCQIEHAAIERLVLCHTNPGDTVHCWCGGADRQTDGQTIRKIVISLDRKFNSMNPGVKQQVQQVNLPVSTGKVIMDGQDELLFKGIEKAGYFARYSLMDARAGLKLLGDVTIDDVVTSPPYNIGYDPFNVPKPDPKTGTLVAPERVGYVDDLPQDEYFGMLEETFRLLDGKLSGDSSDVFINIKNNYKGGSCKPPFWLLKLVPGSWKFSDVLVWRYDISFDPGRNKYKPYYEWVFRFSKGTINRPENHQYFKDFYLPILKGNSKERKNLIHPAIFPKDLVIRCLQESGHDGLVVDPFLGSGSTLAAALELGRSAIGFEIDETYKRDIEERIKKFRE